MAQNAAKDCLKVKSIINNGLTAIDQYLAQTILDSKTKLKLIDW